MSPATRNGSRSKTEPGNSRSPDASGTTRTPMPKFEGCTAGHEISFVKRGANPHTAVLLAKTAATPPESADMEVKLFKALLGMNDVTKAYALALPEDKLTVFMAKTMDEQAAEATAAKTAAEAEAQKRLEIETGKSARELELEKTLATQRTEIDELKAARTEDNIEKRATIEFAGFPGGNAAVVPLLKAYAGLPEAARLASENVLKAQITLAKSAGATFGKTEEELAKFAPATTELVTKAAEIAKSRGI